MNDFGDFLGVAGAAVDVARNTIHATSVGSVTAKGDRDMVTDVDYAVEREVREFLAEETPHIGFLGEEEGSSGETGPLVWTLDPVDGTANYVRGLPLCGVSLALLDRGKPVVGVIDLPFLDSRYTAAYGIGARSNGEVIGVSTVAKLSEAIVSVGDFAVGAGSEEKNIQRLRLTASLAARVQRVRMFGSAAIDLAWVAHGRTDACVMLVNNPWDVAAGVIIAREAGAAVVSVDGSDHRADSSGTIAVAPHLLEPLMSLIRSPSEAEV